MPPLALIGGYVPTNPPPIALRKVGKFKVLLLDNTRTLRFFTLRQSVRYGLLDLIQYHPLDFTSMTVSPFGVK